MLTLLVFVVPYYILYLILKDYVLGRRRAIPMAFVLWLVFLYCFWTIGDPFPILTKSSHGIFSIEQVPPTYPARCLSYSHTHISVEAPPSHRLVRIRYIDVTNPH